MHTLIHKYNIHCAHGRMLVTFRLPRVSLSERTQLFSESVTARFCPPIISSHSTTIQAQWLNVSWGTGRCIGKVLVPYLQFISYNKPGKIG